MRTTRTDTVSRRTALHPGTVGSGSRWEPGAAGPRRAMSTADHPLTGVWLAMANPPPKQRIRNSRTIDLRRRWHGQSLLCPGPDRDGG